MSTVVIIANSSFIKVKTETKELSLTCKHGQCSAIAKSTKKRCGNCAQANSSYCWSHSR